MSAPPQAVSVVQLTNSSSISVSWEPPPHNSQSGIVREYKVSRRLRHPFDTRWERLQRRNGVFLLLIIFVLRSHSLRFRDLLFRHCWKNSDLGEQSVINRRLRSSARTRSEKIKSLGFFPLRTANADCPCRLFALSVLIIRRRG